MSWGSDNNLLLDARSWDEAAPMSTNLKRADFVMIAHLQATWNRARRENVDPQLSVEREERSFSLVCKFDPTDGLYHGWLSSWRRRLWDERGFRVPLDGWELAQVHSALARFHAIKGQLHPDRRDVGQYLTVDDLASAIPTRIAENQRRQEIISLKAKAYAESDVLYHEGPWRVVRLKGFAAARFWGMGTKWCTTMGEHTYWSYAAGGELLVFLTPGGKFQLATRNQIFRNERDGAVDPKAFQCAPAEFRRLLLEKRSRT